MSATHEEATAAILDAFTTAWSNATPVAYPNLAFTPPENEPWVRVTVRHASGEQIGLGTSPCFRRTGVAIVQVFVPEATAGQPALALADQVVAALQAQQLAGGVQMLAARVDEVGPDQRGAWQVNVSVPFRYHHRP